MHPNSHSNKKITAEVILFLTTQGTQLINATVTANQSRHGVSFLSMSAGSELEPGPSWPGRESSQKMVHRLGVLMMSRAAQAMARLAGWGEFTGG